MSIRPVHDFLLIRPDEPEEMTPSGIILPTKFAEKPTRGTVLRAGPGRIDDKGKLIPMFARAGDSVMYGIYNCKSFEVDGEKLVFVADKDVLGIVEDGSVEKTSSNMKVA
jgi:chaperonin GroES